MLHDMDKLDKALSMTQLEKAESLTLLRKLLAKISDRKQKFILMKNDMFGDIYRSCRRIRMLNLLVDCTGRKGEHSESDTVEK